MKRFQTLLKLKNKKVEFFKCQSEKPPSKYNLQTISQYGGANKNRSSITMHHQLLEKKF